MNLKTKKILIGTLTITGSAAIATAVVYPLMSKKIAKKSFFDMNRNFINKNGPAFAIINKNYIKTVKDFVNLFKAGLTLNEDKISILEYKKVIFQFDDNQGKFLLLEIDVEKNILWKLETKTPKETFIAKTSKNNSGASIYKYYKNEKKVTGNLEQNFEKTNNILSGLNNNFKNEVFNESRDPKYNNKP